MADITVALSLPEPATGVQLKEKYKDMGDGTHARVVSNAAGGGGSVDAAALAALGVYANPPLTIVNEDAVATAATRVMMVDASADDVTITLPAANASGAGYSQQLRIKRVDDSANTVTVQRAGADTVDGAASTAIPALQSKDFNSDGVSLWGVC